MEGIALVGVTIARDRKEVIRDLDMRIAPGEITALLGANGAGKSTLVMAIAGILPVSKGQILLDGKDITGMRPEAIRRLGVVTLPEGHPVLTDLTVRDNLEVAGSGLSRTELANAVQAALDVFPELQPKLKATARDLSGGQQQMLCLAQGLISKPRFLLADELSLGLAPVIVQRLVSVISELTGSGAGALLIEQFTELALRISKHAYVLERGRIRFAGRSEELRRDPSLLESAYLAGPPAGQSGAAKQIPGAG